MKIAIHNKNGGFTERWITYCIEHKIDYKLVNCYSNNIIEELSDCNALMWHFYHASAKDVLFAKQLLYSVEMSGKKVFPDFNTMWHFDDKVGQKYLLESMNAPLVPSYIFYNRDEAMKWIKTTDFPKVFKLRGGAGSQNVLIVKSAKVARKFVSQAFGKGFKHNNSISDLKERWRKYLLGKLKLSDLFKGLVRIFYSSDFSRVHQNEKGYIYFQDFIPNNTYDIRIIIVDNKAFAIKRMVRVNDFRASGSGFIVYNKDEINEKCIKIAFENNEKINSQCIAYDFVFDTNNNPVILEISYGFLANVYDNCKGYWDRNLKWYPGKFNPYGWMVDMIK